MAFNQHGDVRGGFQCALKAGRGIRIDGGCARGKWGAHHVCFISNNTRDRKCAHIGVVEHQHAAGGGELGGSQCSEFFCAPAARARARAHRLWRGAAAAGRRNRKRGGGGAEATGSGYVLLRRRVQKKKAATPHKRTGGRSLTLLLLHKHLCGMCVGVGFLSLCCGGWVWLGVVGEHATPISRCFGWVGERRRLNQPAAGARHSAPGALSHSCTAARRHRRRGPRETAARPRRGGGGGRRGARLATAGAASSDLFRSLHAARGLAANA